MAVGPCPAVQHLAGSQELVALLAEHLDNHAAAQFCGEAPVRDMQGIVPYQAIGESWRVDDRWWEVQVAHGCHELLDCILSTARAESNDTSKPLVL